VPIEQKLLAHERDLLVLFRVSFFCPNLAYCSREMYLATVSKVHTCSQKDEENKNAL